MNRALIERKRWAGIVDLPSARQYALEIRFHYNLYKLRDAAGADRVRMPCETSTTQCGEQSASRKKAARGSSFTGRRRGTTTVNLSFLLRSPCMEGRPSRICARGTTIGPGISGKSRCMGAQREDQGSRTFSRRENGCVETGEVRGGGDRYPAGTLNRFDPAYTLNRLRWCRPRSSCETDTSAIDEPRYVISYTNAASTLLASPMFEGYGALSMRREEGG
jgi:hypothetical protein